MSEQPSDHGLQRVLPAIERNRRRMWAVCYRLTGERAAADDLSQEACARAIERAGQCQSEDAAGWLLRLTTRLCLDHLRHLDVVARANALVDPVLCAPPGDDAGPEDALILRDDLRYAVIVALQRLPPRQRTALVLRDVCECSTADVAEALDTNPNAAKSLLHRARRALRCARVHAHVDVPADPDVARRLADAIETGDIEGLTRLLAPDVWGVVDGGIVVKTAKKPTFGAKAVGRQWANAKRRLNASVAARLHPINGEAAVVVTLAGTDLIVALVHLETANNLVKTLCVNRDPAKIAKVAATIRTGSATGSSSLQ